MIGSLEQFEKEDLFFRNAMAVEVSKGFMGYWVECEKEGSENYVDERLMHPALLDAWIECVVASTNTELQRGGRRQKLFLTSCGRYLSRAAAGILKMAWEAIQNVRAANFESYVMGDEKRRAGCGSSERITTMTAWVPSVEKLYLAMREECFWENMARRLGPVLHCFVPSCSLVERSFQMLERTGV